MASLAQRGISGTREWGSRPNSNKEQVYFSVDIKQKARTVTGRYWFNLITDGDEGDDASFVPFVGTVQGDTVTIEFDPRDIRGIDDENTRYEKPRDGDGGVATEKRQTRMDDRERLSLSGRSERAAANDRESGEIKRKSLSTTGRSGVERRKEIEIR